MDVTDVVNGIHRMNFDGGPLMERRHGQAVRGAELSVEPLEDAQQQPLHVKIATMPTSKLPECMHLLLEMCFFATAEPTYLTVTVTEASTISFVAEAAVIDRLAVRVPTLAIDDTNWTVVRVGEGSLGFASVGVVERMTEPLADAGIPVLYNSTFSTDYCLLPRERLDDALRTLALHCGDAATAGSSGSAAAAPASSTDELGAEMQGHTHPLTVLENAPSHVLRLEKRHRQRHTGALLRLLFMPQPDDAPPAIASLTETADEISLVACASRHSWWVEYLAHEGADYGLQHDDQEWVPIRVGGADGTPIEEIGVIATQAKVLAEADISILYLSTFFSDFTLVQRADVERAAEAFESAGFALERR